MVKKTMTAKKKLRKKLYALVEFPYPSGKGLHMGHAFTFNLMDIFARKKMLEGMNVLYPMGWDAFGLPTENYARKLGIDPRIVTKNNIARFKEQMKILGLQYDWNREINTSDPQYYKWTQWIFEQLFKHGLAYKKEMEVNWCPQCQTALAAEEVIGGKCERCGTEVILRRLPQWMLKITSYADRLIDELSLIDFPESVVTAQKNWIGRSNGFEIDFPIIGLNNKNITIFTTRIETIFGVSFVAISSDHPLTSYLIKSKKKEFSFFQRRIEQTKKLDNYKNDIEGFFTGFFALNPINQEKIPIYIANFVINDYASGAIMGVPAHDERDFIFAKKYNLPIKKVLDDSDQQERLINSAEFNGLTIDVARKKILEKLQNKGIARTKKSYRLRDWIFSRQRYWGEPIPMIFCPHCASKKITWWTTKEGKNFKPLFKPESGLEGWFPIPERELPLLLPEFDKNLFNQKTGSSPLANYKEWVETKCYFCGKKAYRETDVMPNWAGSSWYYIRYCDPSNNKKLADLKKIKYWLPVDIYLGGSEHTTLHLLYSRFWYKFLSDIGVVIGKEPFNKRLTHGMILGEDGQKMSKSRGNVVDPEEIINKYGSDALRLYLAFIGPYDGVFPWNTAGINGMKRFLVRLENWIDKVGHQLINNKRNIKTDDNTRILINKLIKGVGEDIDAFKMNTAIAKIMSFFNEIDTNVTISRSDFKKILIILSCFIPFTIRKKAEELGINQKFLKEKWPKYNNKLLKINEITWIIQLNGRTKWVMKFSSDVAEDKIKEKIFLNKQIKECLNKVNIKRTIIIPERHLINFVF